MSIEKVERYKKEKYNRKKTLAKKKRHKIYAIVVCVLVLAAIFGYAGKGIYDKYFYYDSVADIDYTNLASAISNVQNAVATPENATDNSADEDESADSSNDDESDTAKDAQ